MLSNALCKMRRDSKHIGGCSDYRACDDIGVGRLLDASPPTNDERKTARGIMTVLLLRTMT